MKYDIKLVAFDFDGTLTKKSDIFWYPFYEKLGCLHEGRRLMVEYHLGYIDYKTWADNVLTMFREKGLNKFQLDIESYFIDLREGAIETLEELRSKDLKLCIISRGIDYFINKAFNEKISLFHDIMATKLYFDREGNLSSWDTNPYGQDKYKADGLKKLAKKHSVSLEQCAFIGNDYSDVAAFKIAGLPIAIGKAYKHLRKVCKEAFEEDIREIYRYIVNDPSKSCYLDWKTRLWPPIDKK